MKKILTNNIVEDVRRQPFNKASLEHIQESYNEVIADIMKALTDNATGVVVLHGLVDSDGGATSWNISAGAVLYNGEVFQVDAFVGSDPSDVPVLVLDETYRAGDPVKFSDNNEYNVHVIRKLKFEMAGTGTGIADFEELVRYNFTKKQEHIQFIIDGGGVVLSTGSKGNIIVPFDCTITGWQVLADVSGSVVVDLRKGTYSGFPTVASIAGTEKPTLTAEQKNQDIDLDTWSINLLKGDILDYNVESATTVKRITVNLIVERI